MGHYNGIRYDLCGHGCVSVRGTGMQCMSHVQALDARSLVPRGNSSSYHLIGCGCVGPTMMLGPLRGVYVTSTKFKFGV